MLRSKAEMGSGKPQYVVPGADAQRVRYPLSWLLSVRALGPGCKPSPDVGSSMIKAALQGHAVEAGCMPAFPAVFGFFFYTIEFCVVKTGQVLLSRRATSPREWEECRG